MDIFKGFQLICDWANKDQNGRTFTPDQFNIALEAVDLEMLKTKYGLPENYRPGSPIPPQAWEITQKISDDLRHLKVHMGGRDRALMTLDQYGFASIPSDYLHVSSVRYDSAVNNADSEVAPEEKTTTIEVLKDSDFDSRLTSKIKNNFTKYPICRFQNSYIEFRPRTMKFVSFSYIRIPTPAYLSATYDADFNLVYDEAGSRQLDWPADMHIDIFNTIYQWLCRNLKDMQGAEQAQSRKVMGH